jgi:OmpA-OmpF porin, OOP family
MRYTRVKQGRGDEGRRVLAAFAFALVTVLTPVAAVSAQTAAPAPTTTYPTGRGAKVTGLIVSRMGNTLIVKDDQTQGITWVTLNNGTRVYSPSGFLNLTRKGQPRDALVPGLIVKVYGNGGPDGNLNADRISFHKSAEKVAAQASAGEVDLDARQRNTNARALANSDSLARARIERDSMAAALDAVNARVTNLDAYDVKDKSTVNFASGSANLDQNAKTTLGNLVQRNKGLSGFLVEVNGFADATGGTAMNQRLSQRRADAVVAYLSEVTSVPVRRIPSPRGFGTSRPVASNETTDGRAQNRRVEVKVLVNRGLSSSSQ